MMMRMDEEEKHKIYARMTCTKIHYEKKSFSSLFSVIEEVEVSGERRRISFSWKWVYGVAACSVLHCQPVHSTIGLGRKNLSTE